MVDTNLIRRDMTLPCLDERMDNIKFDVELELRDISFADGPSHKNSKSKSLRWILF